MNDFGKNRSAADQRKQSLYFPKDALSDAKNMIDQIERVCNFRLSLSNLMRRFMLKPLGEFQERFREDPDQAVLWFLKRYPD